jgi:thioredoxin-dependent peroxiredoxin
MNLKIGDKAPEFNLPDQDGKPHKLGDSLGKWLLVYFYPKDDTSGCTKEACSVRDNLPAFSGIGAEVFGISADSVDSHKNFAQKYGLSFTLLSDETKQTIKAYDSLGNLGVVRNSFLINPQGQIARIYETVDPQTHAGQVLEDLKKLIV